MATSTPVKLGSSGASVGPVRSTMPGTYFVPVSFNAGTYSTGGEPFTEPTYHGNGSFIGLIIFNPVDLANDWQFQWDGSTSSPAIDGYVLSTGAQIANGVDVSGHTMYALAVYQA